MILVSSTEPAHIIAALRAAVAPELLVTSTLPEQYGADVVWTAPSGLWGGQRKTWRDLMASVEDGRLAREAMLWQELARPVIIVEGRPAAERNWTIQSLRNVLRSCESAGAWIEWAIDADETVQIAHELITWSRKPTHTSLLTRPPVAKDPLGRPMDIRNWILQGFPGIGKERAQAILDHFGGLPLAWTCSEKELTKVPGIGKHTAKTLIQTAAAAAPLRFCSNNNNATTQCIR